MKKVLYVGLIMMFIGLCGCFSPQIYTNPTNTPKPTNTSTPTMAVKPTVSAKPKLPTSTPIPSISDVEIYFDKKTLEMTSKENQYTVYLCVNLNGYDGELDFDFWGTGEECFEFSVGEWEEFENEKFRNPFCFTLIKDGVYKLTAEIVGTNNSSTVELVGNLPLNDKTTYSKDITYENLARYPDNYKDERISFTGKVTQVTKEDYFGEVTARMNANNDSDQNLYFVYDKDIIDYNLLTDDEITIYGVFTGLYSYTTVLGNELTVPKMEVYMIEIKEKPKEVIPTADDIEIVKEYTMSNSWYTYHFMVIRNNSKATVELSTSTMAYSKDGKVLGLSEKSEEAIGSGCEVLIYETFDKNSEIHSFSTEFDVSKENYYLSVIQDLSYEEIAIDDGAIFKVTNNGEKSAEFVQGYALFIKDGIVVDYESAYFTDNDSEIKPGKSVSKQLDTNEEFDTIEFYLSGRADD